MCAAWPNAAASAAPQYSLPPGKNRPAVSFLKPCWCVMQLMTKRLISSLLVQSMELVNESSNSRLNRAGPKT